MDRKHFMQPKFQPKGPPNNFDDISKARKQEQSGIQNQTDNPSTRQEFSRYIENVTPRPSHQSLSHSTSDFTQQSQGHEPTATEYAQAALNTFRQLRQQQIDVQNYQISHIDSNSVGELNNEIDTFLTEYKEEAIEANPGSTGASKHDFSIRYDFSTDPLQNKVIKRGPRNKYADTNEQGIYFKLRDTDFIVHVPKLDVAQARASTYIEQARTIMNKARFNSVRTNGILQSAINETWNPNIKFTRRHAGEWELWKVVE